MAQPKKKTHAEKAAGKAAGQRPAEEHRRLMAVIALMFLEERESRSVPQDPIHFLSDVDKMWSAEERAIMSSSNKRVWETIVTLIKTKNIDDLRLYT